MLHSKVWPNMLQHRTSSWCMKLINLIRNIVVWESHYLFYFAINHIDGFSWAHGNWYFHYLYLVDCRTYMVDYFTSYKRWLHVDIIWSRCKVLLYMHGYMSAMDPGIIKCLRIHMFVFICMAPSNTFYVTKSILNYKVLE